MFTNLYLTMKKLVFTFVLLCCVIKWGSAQVAEEYFKTGQKLMNEGAYSKAIEAYDNGLAFQPNAALAYYQRGRSKEALGLITDAMEDYDKMLEFNARSLLSIVTYCRKGDLLLGLGKKDEALAHYNKAIDIKPDYVLSYYYRAKALDDDEAIIEYDKIVAMDPKPSIAYSHRARVKKRQGRYEEAMSDYNESIKADLKNAVAYYHRGKLHKLLNKPEKAATDYAKAIELDPKLKKEINYTENSVKDDSKQVVAQDSNNSESDEEGYEWILSWMVLILFLARKQVLYVWMGLINYFSPSVGNQTTTVSTVKPVMQAPPAPKPYANNPVESKSPQKAKQLDYAAKSLWLSYGTIEEEEFWQDYEALLGQVKRNA